MLAEESVAALALLANSSDNTMRTSALLPQLLALKEVCNTAIAHVMSYRIRID
jgi:hypothetical protein